MKIIKKIFKSLYKLVVYSLFKLIYGKIYPSSGLYSHDDLIITKTNNKKIKNSDKNNYSIYELKNSRVCNDFVENVAVIHKNKILTKISYQQVNGKLKDVRHNSVIYKGTPYLKKKINGNVLCLTQGASGHTNYFHWLYDILPKIKLYSEKYKLTTLDYFYLSRLQEYQKKTLQSLGLDGVKILDAKKYRHFSADKIFAVEHPWYNKGYVLKEVNKLPSWIVQWIRNSFLKNSKKFNCNEKIFIDRSESSFNHCQLINNQEVHSFLKEQGFTKYKVGQLSWEKQIYLFKNAKVIVGAHGAAFANLAFCAPRTKIIEIKPKYHPNYVSKTIGKINDLNVKIIETPKVSKKIRFQGDILLDINKLKKSLD